MSSVSLDPHAREVATASPGRLRPAISVVVLTWNRRLLLRRCLESLTRQSLRAEQFEVVLVDVSTPPCRDVVADFAATLQIRHVLADNGGVAVNRNLGVAEASADIVAFLDDDCIAEPGWLSALRDALAANPTSIVGGTIVPTLPSNPYCYTGQLISDVVDGFFNRTGAEPRFFPGLNCALERRAFLALGGCDAAFGRLAAEDRDFIDRWRLAGRHLLRAPEAVVQHEHRTSLSGFIRQYFIYGRGAWRYHTLRRRRGSGHFFDDASLHLVLPHHLRGALRMTPPLRRLQIVALIGVWQLANVAGFFFEALREGTRGAAEPRA